VVSMVGAHVHDRFRDVRWGVATARSLATPSVVPRQNAARGWAGDVAEIMGVEPAGYRAVLGWRRVQPDGPGGFDERALGRCDRALDDLLARGLQPGVTLLHLDAPEWLARDGGWLCRESALRFADYTHEMGRRFGDRVVRWTTTSDIAGPSVADHVAGMWPKGRGSGPAGLQAVHHVLLAAGLAGQALRAAGVGGHHGDAHGRLPRQ